MKIFIQQYMHWHNVTFFFFSFAEGTRIVQGDKKKQGLKQKKTKTKILVSESHAWPRMHLVTFVGTRLDNTGGR